MNKKILIPVLAAVCVLVIGVLIWQGGKAKTPTAPVAPPDYTRPTDPATPTDPAQPTDPVEPTDPVDPVEPTDPVVPTDPVEPGEETGDDEPEYYIDEDGNLVIIVPGDQGSGGL